MPTGSAGEACGKAILAGEHFVVYGAPALAVPVRGRRISVRVARAPGPWRCPPGARTHLEAMLDRLGLAPAGVTVEVAGDIPTGVGLGGSAALAVALVRALGVTEPAEVQRLAHDLESLAHGRPSGIDDATVAWERPVRLEHGAGLRLLPAASPPLWVVVTPAGPSTREAIGRVASWRDAHRVRFDAMVAATRGLVDGAEAALVARDWAGLGRVMDASGELLDEVGAVTPAIARICRELRRHGAWGAKVTGAGFGGALLAIAPESVDVGGISRAAGAVEVMRA